MAYQKELIDDLAKKYPRKDLYVADLIDARESGDKKRLRELQKKKRDHPYNRQLDLFRKAERSFQRELLRDAASYRRGLKDQDLKEKRLATDIFIAEKKLAFYEDYVDLHYDAKYEYEQSRVRVSRQSELLLHYRDLKRQDDEAKALIAAVNEAEDRRSKAEVQTELKSLRSDIAKNQNSSRLKYKSGLISKQAVAASKKEGRQRYQAQKRSLMYSTPKLSKKDLRNNIRHEMTVGMDDKEKVLDAELSSIRRTVPQETRQRFLWKSIFSIIVPGLGQLLLGQRMKALLFFLGTLFIYVIAIPYALGYGNYQGDGISGLISLAEGGLRVERSLIFLIEGVLALLLCFFAILIIVLAFRDARKTEREMLLGIRPQAWTETTATIEREGFPFLVTIPTYVLVILIIGVPIITTFLLSFTNMDPDHQSKFTWIGLANYRVIALGEGLAGSVFWRILSWTIVWTLAASTLQIVIGMILAFLTNNPRLKGKRFFRTIFILPWAVPAFITIIFFSLMLAPDGMLTDIISKVFGAGQRINVKHSPNLTRIALVLIQGWCGSAYIFLLTTGTLQAIPGDLFEAAEIDGATAWQRLRRITLPMILFQTAPLLVGQYTFNFNNFTIIDIFNGGGPFQPSKYGNLAGSSDLLISYIFKLTVTNQYQALGAAISIIISIALIIVAFMGYRQTAAFKEM